MKWQYDDDDICTFNPLKHQSGCKGASTGTLQILFDITNLKNEIGYSTYNFTGKWT